MLELDYKKTIENIRKELKTYLIEKNLKSITVGVSGGIDSALVCALAFPVAKELGIELIGRSITIETNKPDEIERARNIGKYFCTNFKEVNLTNEYLKIKDSISDTDIVIGIKETDIQKKIRLGNIKARLRMIHLYDIAQKNKGFGLSTDNFTELLVGFWTLHGDVFDYGMIQELWKTEVYNMTEWISNNENLSNNASNSLKSMLNAVATDGLGITNSDLDQILPDWKERYSTTREGYSEVDLILENYLNNGAYSDHIIIKRHLLTEFKRNNPIILKREDIIDY
jgi:nicotinamide-nucleotide amidase